jgi:hypothetical protein
VVDWMVEVEVPLVVVGVVMDEDDGREVVVASIIVATRGVGPRQRGGSGGAVGVAGCRLDCPVMSVGCLCVRTLSFGVARHFCVGSCTFGRGLYYRLTNCSAAS